MTENTTQPTLFTREYRTITQINGPLLTIERVSHVAFNEMVEIIAPDGELRMGRVLEVDGQTCLVQVCSWAQTGWTWQTPGCASPDTSASWGCRSPCWGAS